MAFPAAAQALLNKLDEVFATSSTPLHLQTARQVSGVSHTLDDTAGSLPGSPGISGDGSSATAPEAGPAAKPAGAQHESMSSTEQQQGHAATPEQSDIPASEPDKPSTTATAQPEGEGTPQQADIAGSSQQATAAAAAAADEAPDGSASAAPGNAAAATNHQGTPTLHAAAALSEHHCIMHAEKALLWADNLPVIA